MNKISVLFVDINKNGMYGVSRYLSTLPDFELIVKNEMPADNAENFIRYFGPEVIVIDTKQPLVKNFSYVSHLVSSFKNSRVVLYTDSDDQETIEQAIEAGVAGYVIRKHEISSLVQAIKDVADGRYYFSDITNNKVPLEIEHSLQPVTISKS